MNAFLNLFRVPEIRSKILVTLGLLLAYRVGFHVYLPGVDYSALEAEVAQGGGGGFAFGIMNALSGGAMGSPVLFSLGVMPYISASIIFSLLVKVVHQLEAISKEGQAGQKRINRYTRYATVPICLIQAMFIVFGPPWERLVSMGVLDPGLFGTWYYSMFLMVALTTGTLVIMWIGEQITEYGVGNGVSLIIMAGILANIPSLMAQLLGVMDPNEGIQMVATLLVLYLLIMLGIVFVTKGQRRIPIQQGKQTRGRRVYGGQRHYLPLKVNQAGVMPIIFASFLSIGTAFLDTAFGGNFFRSYFGPDDFWYIVCYSGLILMFSFFWTALMFQPKEVADNLKEYGGFVPGLRPGARTAEYLEQVMFRVTLAGATFLVLIAVIPQIVSGTIPQITGYLAYFLGGTSILIVVGVLLDLIEKVNALLLMRRYEGLGESGGSGWARKGSRGRGAA